MVLDSHAAQAPHESWHRAGLPMDPDSTIGWAPYTRLVEVIARIRVSSVPIESVPKAAMP